jgi:LPS-assembly protein
MLLEADQLIYDRDAETVSAIGKVQIDYDGLKLVADKVTYNQVTRRLMASGNVEIIDKQGNRFFSDSIDITDDFADGFVQALRVETTDNTRFAAESATRENGNTTTFQRGVYTACEPCRDNPEKPAKWQVKAQTIIWNGEKKTIRFEGARFEFFGISTPALPPFEIADPTVKRKTGFLMPRYIYNTELGHGGAVPFYLNLAPSYDLTIEPRFYSRQGLFGQAEYRQRFANGEISITAAGISQKDPSAFVATRVDSTVKQRGMIGTKGNFTINPKWSFGWDVLVQSDKNFSKTYSIEGYDGSVHTTQAWLTGLNGRNYFDVRAMRFDVQENLLDSNAASRSSRQPVVLPSFDYAKTFDQSVGGGQLSLLMNGRMLDRSVEDRVPDIAATPVFEGRLPGTAGRNGRLTAEVEWKRTMIAPGGLAVTPIFALRGDAGFSNLDPTSAAAIAANAAAFGTGAVTDAHYFRGMATAGLDLRWPVVFSTTSATHIIEPVAQIFVRPNERYAGNYGIINEDAQSLVFDASTLFDRDKFSGFDRIEGGTRANLGIRYTGSFANGWSASAVVGQSFHLAGVNSFAQPDLVNAGAFSGLETNRSDYVGMVALTAPNGTVITANGRFDERTFEMRRAGIDATVYGEFGKVTAGYSFIDAQPGYGFAKDRHGISAGTSIKLTEHWKATASTVYEITTNTFVSTSVGFNYADECLTFGVGYTQLRTPRTNNSDRISHTIGLRLSLRTLGDIATTQDITSLVNP